MIHFRKPPVDTLTITDGVLLAETAEGARAEGSPELLDQLYRDRMVLPETGLAIPDGVKFIEKWGNRMVVVHQQAPMVRSLQWISNDSKNRKRYADYRTVRISLPYTITVMGLNTKYGAIQDLGMYFTSKPLTHVDSLLGFPTLPNMFKVGGRSYTCCPHDFDGNWQDQLNALLQSIWESGFNYDQGGTRDSYSSSARSVAPAPVRADSGLEQIHPVENWEAQTRKDPGFILGVEWESAGTVREQINGMFERTGIVRSVPISQVFKTLSYKGNR